MNWPLTTEGLESVRITCYLFMVGSHTSTILLLITFEYLVSNFFLEVKAKGKFVLLHNIQAYRWSGCAKIAPFFFF